MDPGTALAIASLSFQVFGGCVKGFMLLSKAHNLGEEASYLQTLLSLEEYRFIQWAGAVDLLKDSGHVDNDDEGGASEHTVGDLIAGTGANIDIKLDLQTPVNPRLNTVLAARLMAQLQILLSTDKLRERYKLELTEVPDLPTSSAVSRLATTAINMQEPATAALEQLVPDALRQRIIGRAKLVQRKNHLPKRLWWAAVDKKNFETMIADVRAIVNGLWALLHPVQQTDSYSLMRDVLATVVQISQNVGELKALQRSVVEQTHPDSLHDNNSISVAANVKIARLAIHNVDATNTQTASAVNWTLPAVNRGSLTEVVQSSSNAHVARGLYEDQAVWLEYKVVPRRMKGKLISRVKNLALLLAQPKDFSFRTLQCIGYLEEETRFVFLYRYPSSSEQDEEKTRQQPKSLVDLMREQSHFTAVSVTTRLNIARELCKTLLTLHTSGWLHKDLRSENIVFFAKRDWLAPYITGFSFSRQDSATEISEQPSSEPQADIYRHPHALGEPSASFQKHMDLYSLGLILVELGEWKALKHIIKDCVDVRRPDSITVIPLDQIGSVPKWLIRHILETGQIKYRMGDVYAEVVHICLNCGLTSEGEAPDTLPDLLAMVRKLERCQI